ncbi:MAG TPA: VCBS repeat-containing protein [Flavitalea sp.]|nr:VCBS repeat-containing protein [Flavitalea sp.]
MRMFDYKVFILLLFVCCACENKDKHLFNLMENTGIDFTNTVRNNKQFNIFTYRNFYNGGGVAIGDINNDGLPDVFFTANMSSNKLYLNQGQFQFEDITEKAGILNKGKWATGIVFVDINHDNWLDIYVCFAGYQKGISNANELYINNKNSTFTEAAAQYNLNDSGYTTHAAFFDYDLDGDLDCYLLKNSFIPVNTLNYVNKRELRAADWPVADFLKGGGDKLLRNDDGKYTDISVEANIYGSLIGFGLGVTIGDINGDMYPDIYISNDFFEKDYLYINQKNGSFKEDLENWMQHISQSSMGADIADVNNDGYPDVFTTDMLPDDDYRLKTTTSFENYDINQLKLQNGFYHQFMQNTLQINSKNGKFYETAFYSGVAASDWSWGGLIFDADNDGLSDLFICNGIYNDVTDQDFIDFFANDVIQKMVLTGEKNEMDDIINKMPSHPIPNKAFRNIGSLKFSNNTEEWGLNEPSFSNGAAYGDLDNDGDLDLIVNNVNQKAFVYENNSRQVSGNNYIGFLLKGNASNTFAIGSTVKVFQGSQIITREIIPTRGFQSSVDYKIIIGLGKGYADSMTIIWPNLSVNTYLRPEINKVHVITQNKTDRYKYDSVKASKSTKILKSINADFEKHKEDVYVDFYYERGVPMMISKEGPKAAYGDVDNNGLTDVYICGAAGQAGQLYMQTSNGFHKKKVFDFERMAAYEDVDALFFDMDGDKDLDLFVGSGGNKFFRTSPELQNRIYKNDGKGNFTIDPNQLENMGMNTCCSVAEDFDQDGDIDLFIGSRSVPQNYGATPRSSLYLNDGTGKFTDISKTLNGGIAKIGMVTAATAADVNGDGRKELIVVGEWMAPKIFTFTNGGFKEIQSNLNSLYGWWRSVKCSDVDKDGDEDLVLGNIGENFYLHPNKNNPVKMFINDFERKGISDKIITRTVDGKDKPIFLKKDLLDQLTTLRKQNLKYFEYADKSVQELIKEDDLRKSAVKIFDYSSSCIALNEGDGRFTIKKLPLNVQLSSVNAIHVCDLNNDNLPDLILGGNEFNFLPQFCRLDASYGHVLINKGNGEFEWLPSDRSGLELRGQIRDIVELKGRNKRYLLILQNNEAPVLYSLDERVTDE